MVMTRLGRIIVAILIAAWPAGAAPPGSQQADLVVTGQGATSDAEPTTLRCELNLVTTPSNVFVGRCLVEVGPEQLVLGDLAVDGAEPMTVVLDGHVIVRGGAVTATGRFQELLQSSQSGFPVYVEVDPLGRSWAVRGHGGNGDVETVAGGRMTEGAVHFRLP
jgi:hypothetical protein